MSVFCIFSTLRECVPVDAYRLVRLSHFVVDSSETLSTSTAQLADVNDQLEGISEQLAHKSDTVSDTGPIQKIRTWLEHALYFCCPACTCNRVICASACGR